MRVAYSQKNTNTHRLDPQVRVDGWFRSVLWAGIECRAQATAADPGQCFVKLGADARLTISCLKRPGAGRKFLFDTDRSAKDNCRFH